MPFLMESGTTGRESKSVEIEKLRRTKAEDTTVATTVMELPRKI